MDNHKGSRAAFGTALKRNGSDLPLGLQAYRDGEFAELHACGSGVLTASNVNALFGLSRYAGRYAVACHIAGKAAMAEPDNDTVYWGKEFEAPILARAAKQEDWDIRQITAYARCPTFPRLLASPDAVVRCVKRAGVGLVEVKDVAEPVFEQRWQNEPPIDVHLQHQAQYACCPDANWGAVVALVHGAYKREVKIFPTAPDGDAIEIILRETAALFDLLDKGELPEPDLHPSSIDALGEVYPDVIPGKSLVMMGEEAAEASLRFDRWEQAKRDRLAAEKVEEAQRSWFLTRALDAEELKIGNARSVRVKTIKRKAYTVEVRAKSFRKWDLIRRDDEIEEL
jgi:hypothetical protein